MNTPTLSPSLQAASLVIQRIITTASSLIGLGALAYIIGWQESSTYFSNFGAPWVTNLLSTARIMQTSAWVAWISIFFMLSCIISLAEGATHKSMRWQAIITLGIGICLTSLDAFELLTVSLKARALLMGLGAILFAISTGFTLGEVIARFKEDKFRWSAYHLYLLIFSISLAFNWSPTKMGEARAKLSMDSQSTSLPVVELTNVDSQHTWHLLDVTDGNAMMGFPPFDKEAPLIKSICPPIPEYW